MPEKRSSAYAVEIVIVVLPDTKVKKCPPRKPLSPEDLINFFDRDYLASSKGE